MRTPEELITYIIENPLEELAVVYDGATMYIGHMPGFFSARSSGVIRGDDFPPADELAELGAWCKKTAYPGNRILYTAELTREQAIRFVAGAESVAHHG